MEWVHLLRWAHVIGACVLLGTGVGIAFFMVMAQRTKDADAIAHVSSTVVIADWIFTGTSVIAQPITGALLATEVGWKLTEGWILLSLSLYVLVGALWLPVVWIQQRMRDLARFAAASGSELPVEYHRLYRIWFVMGFPAFAGVLAIIWLMIARPTGLFG